MHLNEIFVDHQHINYGDVGPFWETMHRGRKLIASAAALEEVKSAFLAASMGTGCTEEI